MALDNLEDLMAAWRADSKINETQLDLESLKQANLHSKWLDILTMFKIKCHKIERDITETKSILTRYFNGVMTKEELEALGRPQYLNKTPLKSELEKLLDSDQEVLDLKQKLLYYVVLAEYADSVLRAIRDRGFSIKTAVDYQRFIAGN